MNHFVLFLACILSIEVFIRFDFLSILDSIFMVSKKVIYVIPNAHISDHWKEKVIPEYALQIMKFSLKVLIILLFILSFFLIGAIFFDNFLMLILSFIGIIESIIFAFIYLFLRKKFIR